MNCFGIVPEEQLPCPLPERNRDGVMAEATRTRTRQPFDYRFDKPFDLPFWYDVVQDKLSAMARGECCAPTRRLDKACGGGKIKPIVKTMRNNSFSGIFSFKGAKENGEAPQRPSLAAQLL